MPSAQSEPGVVRLPHAAISLGAGIIALASLGTLVTVVALKDIDALSTVALALAIIAFVVQLIVFVLQSVETNRQSTHAEELHGRLVGLLSQIEERTQGTQHSVDAMSTRMLEALIGKASNEGLATDSREFAQVVATGLSNARTSQREPVDLDSTDWPPPLPAEQAALIHAEMRSWPDPADSAALLPQIAAMDFQRQCDLARFARDMYKSTEPGMSIGPGLFGMGSEDLKEMGLLEDVPGWNMYRLSAAGRRVGRVFTAVGDPPAGTPSKLLEVRSAVEASRRREVQIRTAS